MNLVAALQTNPTTIDEVLFGQMVNGLNNQISKVASPDFKSSAQAALDALLEHKDDIIGMTTAVLGEWLIQLASGDTKSAQLTYIKHATIDELINGMDYDAGQEIAHVEWVNRMKAEAITITEDIAVAGAVHLLPIVLALII